MSQGLQELRLHIGGEEPRAGWKILNIQPGPNVDFVGTCTDLGQFESNSVDEIYASHVYEHLSYQNELLPALKEAHRVLKPGGVFSAAVPDLDALVRLFVHPGLKAQDRYVLMRVIFGGQMDAFDYHKAGLTWEFFSGYLRQAGFANIVRVQQFDLFKDTSTLNFKGAPISLNVRAIKS